MWQEGMVVGETPSMVAGVGGCDYPHGHIEQEAGITSKPHLKITSQAGVRVSKVKP